MVQKLQQGNRPSRRPTENLTGIPIQMKIDFEQRSGMSFDDVRVHYHSAEPAKLGALAFTRGEHVYIGPGQERHLRHELTHVVQQKQGIVAPTGTVGGLPVSNDPELERLAENGTVLPRMRQASRPAVVQRIPTPGKAAEKRFTYLVDKKALTSQRNAVTKELLRIGVPLNIAQAAENACINQNAQSAGRRKQICRKTIRQKYNQLSAVSLGADYRYGIQQNAQLRQMLIDALMEIYLPLIQANNVGTLYARVKKAIRFRFLPGARVRRKASMIKEGIERMNRLIVTKTKLPRVIIGDRDFGATTEFPRSPRKRGKQSYGTGVGPSQVMHEQGHHVENHLNVNKFANLHNYLYRHTNPGQPDRVSGWNRPWALGRRAPLGGMGYNIDFPEMNFQNWISRRMHSRHSLLRFGLFNLGNGILFLSSPRRHRHSRGQRFIDDFFLQESNSSRTGYASFYKPKTYATEYLSTTAELLSTARGAKIAIAADPSRIAMFAYLTNRGLYNRIDRAFRRKQHRAQNVTVYTLKVYLSII